MRRDIARLVVRQAADQRSTAIASSAARVRRECTDHLIVFNAEHLRRILSKYARYLMRYGLPLHRRRPRGAQAGSNGLATLLRIRSFADYTIATLESSFRKQHQGSERKGRGNRSK